MAKATPPAIRSIVTDDEFGGFRITIPGPGREANGFCCGCALVFAAVLIGLTLLFIVSDPRENFAVGGKFLAGCTLAVLALGILALTVTDREVVMIDGKTLIVRWESRIGLGRASSFDLAGVRNLRPQFTLRNQAQSLGQAIAFEYGGQTHYFGAGLTREEAIRLVKTIRSRFSIRNDWDDWDDAEPLPVET